MNEDRSSLTRRLRVWLAWLRKTFYPYPKGRQELTELLRALEHRDLIHPEALVMIEGALLMAEMRVPGSAVLELEAMPSGSGRSRIVATAYFHPAGVWGLLYWFALLPVHRKIFEALPAGLARRAESQA